MTIRLSGKEGECCRVEVLPLAVLLALALTPTLMFGQAAGTGTITGRITDETGAPVPEVSVRVTGSALQVLAVNALTDQEGNYQVLDLPAPGVYRVSFAHKGFGTLVRPELNLSVGFAARVDGTLKVGAVEQTVEISGSNPVVDTINTSGGTTLQLT